MDSAIDSWIMPRTSQCSLSYSIKLENLNYFPCFLGILAGKYVYNGTVMILMGHG